MPFLAPIGMAILGAGAAVVGAIGTGIGIAAGVLGAIPLIGGVINVGLSAIGMAMTTSAMLIGAGGIGGAIALARAVSTGLTIVSFFTGSPAIGPAAGMPGVRDFMADPNAPVPYVMGRTGVGGNLRAQLSSNDSAHTWTHWRGVLSGAGPINAIESFRTGGDAITFSGDNATTAPYTDKLKMTTTLGPTTGWSLAQPASSGTVPELTSAHKMSGYASFHIAFKGDPNVFPGGLVDSPLFVVEGVKVYDPRLDSTYPGGSGSCLSTDESTWVYSDNPYLHALTWCLGRRQNAIRFMGLGAIARQIDVAAFVEGANIAEANGWTISGGVTSADSKLEVLAAMLQAGAGIPMLQGDTISCYVSTPRVAIGTITSDDLVADAARPRLPARRDRVNRVIPFYNSEEHDWEPMPATPVEVADYITAEGRRSKEVRYPLVGGPGAADQVSQLAMYAIYNSHEVSPITLPLGARFIGYKRGDLLSAFIPELAMSFDVLIQEIDPDPESMVVNVVAMSETSAKHALALAMTGEAMPAPSATRPDPRAIAAPSSLNWAASATMETGDGWVKPVLKVAGSNADNTAAEEVIAYFRKSGETDWQRFSTAFSTAGGGTVFKQYGLISGSTYECACQYRVRTVLSPLRTFDAVTIPSESAPDGSGGSTPPPDGTVVFDSSDAGADQWISPYAGEIDIAIWGGGGGTQATLTDKKGEADVIALGGGGGEYAIKSGLPLTLGMVVDWVVGAGGDLDEDGGVTGCITDGLTMTANGGGKSAISEGGASPGSGGFGGTGGDSRVSGHGGGLTNSWDGGGAWNPGLADWVDQTITGEVGTAPGGGGAGPAGLGIGGPGNNGRIIGIYREP